MSTDLIDVVSEISTNHKKDFLYMCNLLSTFQYRNTCRTRNQICLDSKHNILSIRDVLFFYTYIGTYHYSIFVKNYIFCHPVYICIQMKYVLQVFLIHLFLWSYWIPSNLNLLFHWEHIFYLIDLQQYYNFHHTSVYLPWMDSNRVH